MMLVDLIIEISPKTVETTFEISEDHIFVENGIFAEIGLVENAAQTCSAIVAKAYVTDENDQELEDVKVIGFISGIKRLKVIALPNTGDTICTKAVLISQFEMDNHSICSMQCRTFRGEELLFE